MEHIADKRGTRLTFTDMMRVRFKGILDPIGVFFNRLGLTPNMMTVLGLFGNAVGAFFLLRGEMLVGGLIVLAMGPIDALDGTMARLRGEPTDFGAFVDSVTDRYSELVILGGLLLYYAMQGNFVGVVAAYLAAAGSVLVSYTRARAQSLGKETKIGILTRLERYLVLAPSLVFNVPLAGLWIIATLANITALQRIADVRRQFRSTNGHE
ncbi:MAG TPA: CDP-alcohol phosphatidyltransferase family protein [Chloroflexi bacterium]|nr:CDP-alcohol phosphatidyltransferase family protein [Chloroflexota bacterium]